jgi:hypothetical protein
MTANNDVDRQLNDFLLDGPTELPYQSFDAVRDRTEQTGQRVVIGPWRLPEMNKILTIGLGAAAVVVAVFIGAQVFASPGGVGGPGDEPTPTPDATPTAEPTVSAPEPTHGPLAEGPFLLVYEQLFGLPVTVTIPAPDWHGLPTVTAVDKHGMAGPPQGAGLVVYGGEMFVYGDPCAWESTRPDDAAASLGELVAALSAQASRDATPAVDVTVGGYPGKMLTLRVPEEADFAACDAGEFRTLIEVSTSGEEAPRAHQGPGQINEVWIVDVDGTLVFFDAGYFADTSAEDVEEMRAMVESATFGAP